MHDESESLSARFEALNHKPPRDTASYVLYWMQQAQRAEWNHALEYAAARAAAHDLPLLAVFVLTPFAEGNRRSYTFMLEGLVETADRLRRRGIKLVVRAAADPVAEVAALAGRARLVVTDAGYLRQQRRWRSALAQRLDCALLQWESDAIVPVTLASDKEEYAARTMRPRIQRYWNEDVERPRTVRPGRDAARLPVDGANPADIETLLRGLRLGANPGPSSQFRGGRQPALRRLDAFLAERLNGYAAKRGDPSLDWVSHMSPYLHFGQLSPLEVLARVRAADAPQVDRDAYVEELVVRRELAINYVYYQKHYDAYRGLPAWARATLQKHRRDPRAVTYTREELERAATHDPYWNAAQRQMTHTGKMHNYMRMYWGKKILEWQADPEEAFTTALRLNNRYEIDGRDPNSFAGVAWCFGKHDRPWRERAIFGTVRYMNDSGLRRKFRIDEYVGQVRRLSS